MGIALLAQIGIGIVSSIVQSVASGTASKSADSNRADAAPAPASRVKLSDAAALLKKNAEAAGTANAARSKTPVDKLLSRSSDSVRKAWEKTRKELGLDAENRDYYINELAMTSLMTEARLSVGTDGKGNLAMNQEDFFGSSVSSAIGAIDAVINRLKNNPLPGYEQNSRDRQAALEMYATFRQNLINA